MTKSISKILLELTSRILHKDPEVTTIAIEYVKPEDWIDGGKSLAEHGKSSIYFDNKVTDEISTKAEEAQYIREAFDAFSMLLGDSRNEGYIYVQEVRSTFYEFSALTQEYRYRLS